MKLTRTEALIETAMSTIRETTGDDVETIARGFIQYGVGVCSAKAGRPATAQRLRELAAWLESDESGEAVQAARGPVN